MRRYELDFKIILLFWIFILLKQAVEITLNIINSPIDCFADFSFYVLVAQFIVGIGLLISIIKQDRKKMLILFGALLLINLFSNWALIVSVPSTTRALLTNSIPELDFKVAFYILFENILLPISLVAYFVFYCVCLVMYLCHSQARFKLIPFAVVAAILLTIFDFAAVCGVYMNYGIEFNFYEVFLDLIATILFDAYLIFTPNYMYNYD